MAEREIVYVLSADDKASAVFKKVAGEADNTSGAIVSGAQKAEKAQASLTTASKELLVGFSGVATAAFSLYQAFDALEKAQYRVQKANVAVDSTTNSVNAAQKTYTETVEKFGVASDEATQALNLLKTAEDRHVLAVDAAKIAQDNLNDTQTRAYLQIIPAGITMIASLVTAWKGMKDMAPAVVRAFGNIEGSVVSLKRNMTLLAGASALGAVIAGWIAISSMSDDVQIAFTIITAALAGLTAAFWLMAGSAAAAWAVATMGSAIPIIAGVIIATGALVYAAGEEMQKNTREQAKRDKEEQMRYSREAAEAQQRRGAFEQPEEVSFVRMPNESEEDMMIRLGFWKGANGQWTNVPEGYTYNAPAATSTEIPAAAGGMEVTKPTLLMAGESGTELILSPEETKAYKSGAKVINNNYVTVQVQQTLDDDLIVEKVVREIRRRTGMNI